MTIPSVLDTSNKVPGSFIRVSLGVGRRSSGANPLKILLYGNKTSTGTAAVGEPVAVYGKDDARTYFGAGSELFLMVQAAFLAWPAATIYAIAIAESAGTAAALNTLIVAGGPATARGSLEVWISGRRIVVGIDVGDTATAVASNVAAAINDQTDWPATAAAALGTVTITAKHKGPRGNSIRVRTKLTAATGITHTAINAALTAGATSDDPQAALDAVAPAAYRFHVAPYSDSTNLAKFDAHVDAADEPEVGLRQRWVAASVDTLANCITASDTTNAKRGQMLWHYNADQTPAEIAAGTAAALAKKISAYRAANLDGTEVPGLTEQFSVSDRPLPNEVRSALNSGITPLVPSGTKVKVLRSITNYHLDGSSNPDYSVLDTTKVDVTDFIADTLEANFTTQFAEFNLQPDGEEPPDPGIATPSTVRDWIYGELKGHQRGRLIVRVDDYRDLLEVEIDPDTDGRVNAIIPCDVIEGLHQFGADVRQIG